MKKSISFLLSIMVLLSISFMPSYAYANNNSIPPGLAKKGGLPPGIAKKFMDMDKYEWAQSYIERMVSKGIIKGVNENEFAPSRNVTKVEALAMIIRTMGWDNEAEEYLELINKGEITDKLKDRLQDWGKGYINLAVEKEIIDEVDLWQQNFTAPATRQDVAKYIIRALGLTDDAEDYMDEDLRFKDAEAVQIGNVGYIYLIDKKEIMTGYSDGTFKPNQSVTRVEMAALVAKLDELLDDEETEDEEVFEGKITAIDLKDKEIVVKTDRKQILFEIENDTVIKIGGKTRELEDLEIGMTVKVIIDNNSVEKILAENEKQEFEGIIVNVYPENEIIKVKVGNVTKTFNVDDDADIELDDEDATLDELEKGMEVEIIVENEKAIKIYAASIEKKYEGKIVQKIEGSVNKLTIKVDGENRTFALDEDVVIELEDGDDIEFKDLEVGSVVEIEVINNIIVKIEVED